MYEMKGYIFIDGQPKQLNTGIIVNSWKEAHEDVSKGKSSILFNYTY